MVEIFEATGKYKIQPHGNDSDKIRRRLDYYIQKRPKSMLKSPARCQSTSQSQLEGLNMGTGYKLRNFCMIVS